MVMQGSDELKTNGAHSWRISLNLTRRIVRRMMELTAAEQDIAPRKAVKATQVPDAQEFRTTVRLLRRAIRRTIVQAPLLSAA